MIFRLQIKLIFLLYLLSFTSYKNPEIAKITPHSNSLINQMKNDIGASLCVTGNSTPASQVGIEFYSWGGSAWRVNPDESNSEQKIAVITKIGLWKSNKGNSVSLYQVTDKKYPGIETLKEYYKSKFSLLVPLQSLNVLTSCKMKIVDKCIIADKKS